MDGQTSQRFPGRAAATFLVTALAGPASGGLLVLVAIGGPPWVHSLLFDPHEPGSAGTMLLDVLGMAAGVVLYSYFFGGLHALLCGAVVAWIVWRTGRLSYRQAIVAAFGVSVAAAAVFAGFGFGAGTTEIAARLWIGLILGIISVVTAVGCRWLLGRIVGLAD